MWPFTKKEKPIRTWDDLLFWWRAQRSRYERVVDGSLTTYQNERDRAVFDLKLKIAPFLQQLDYGYSTCERCHWPWQLVLAHYTDLEPGRGCFPLCEQCWRELGHSKYRMPYYRSAWEKHWDSEPWDIYQAAVLAEDPTDEYATDEYATMIPDIP